MKIQTIGHDKVNQLRHVRFFKDIHGITEHMRKHADSLRPKFEMILDTFERELKGLGAGSWYQARRVDTSSHMRHWMDVQKMLWQKQKKQGL